MITKWKELWYRLLQIADFSQLFSEAWVDACQNPLQNKFWQVLASTRSAKHAPDALGCVYM